MENNNLAMYRKKEKMTQRELAKILDVASDYISMIERGVSTPSLNLAKKIADLFCTTVDSIFFDPLTYKKFEKINTG